MTLKGKKGLAILLIGLGALIILNKAGFVMGHLFGLLFPVILIVLGYIGMKNGRTFIGGAVTVLGVLILLGKLSGLLGLLIAIVLVIYGLKLLSRPSYR